VAVCSGGQGPQECGKGVERWWLDGVVGGLTVGGERRWGLVLRLCLVEKWVCGRWCRFEKLG